MDKNTAIDGALGTGCLSTPLWMGLLNSALQETLLIGGGILLVLRILLAIREWREPRDRRKLSDRRQDY